MNEAPLKWTESLMLKAAASSSLQIRQTWLLHCLYYIILYRYTWITFRKLPLQTAVKTSGINREVYHFRNHHIWVNTIPTHLCEQIHSFMWQFKSTRENNPLHITSYLSVTLLFQVMWGKQPGVDPCHQFNTEKHPKHLNILHSVNTLKGAVYWKRNFRYRHCTAVGDRDWEKHWET